MSVRAELTPQMLRYEAKFTDDGEIRWLPYLMYFHPAAYSSETVSTDRSGFRYSEAAGRRYSVADLRGITAARLLAGSSTVFGIGASSDAWTLSSRLTERDPRHEPWLNFGGRSFNSAQELSLLTLNLHLLPEIREIVLFSGFNNLGLARLPAALRGEHGAFFNCTQFFEALGNGRSKRRLFHSAEPVPTMGQQIAYAAELTLRHLAAWQIFATHLGARLTYVLQPLSGWVRAKGCPEEERLFAELDRLGRFSDTYGDILDPEVHGRYAALLAAGTRKLGAGFVDFAAALAERAGPERWLFADRIHFTDDGHDHAAGRLLDLIG
jgi:hypothetical protein